MHRYTFQYACIFLLLILIAFLFIGQNQIKAQNITSQNSGGLSIPATVREKIVNPLIVYVRLNESDAGRLRSRVKASRLPDELENIVTNIGFEKIDTSFKNINQSSSKIGRWFTFEFSSESQAEQFIQQAQNLPEIEAIERDWKQEIQIVPTDEFYQADSSESLWGHELIKTQQLWNSISNPGEGIVIGIVDTGLSNTGDPNHPSTHKDLVGSEWMNENEIPNNNVDDDGNGLVDDYVGGVADPTLMPSYEDFNGHGTHVAGTIGARANNIGLPGIAFSSKLMPVKLSNGGSWGSSTTVNGFMYAIENGASVINASIGGPSNTLTNDVVEYAFENDVLVVAAAGNDQGANVCTKSPGGSEYAVAVSSVDKNGSLSSFSNVGTGIDIAAPGGGAGEGSSNDILSTRTMYSNPQINVPFVTDSEGNKYISINGTSMATPHVTAAAAIIRQQRPDWNVEEVWAGLKWIAEEPEGVDFNDGFGHGILDLSKIPNLPERIPVAQMYDPVNCFSSAQAQDIVIRGSAYVAGGDVPDEIRIEIAQGHNVSDEDFDVLAVLQSEVENDVLYTWDGSNYPLGAYTLRVVTQFEGYSIEDRNQIAFVMYDFKTALRMQVMKMLGFQSVMPSNPSSSESFVYQPKSYFDRFLKFYNEETQSFEDVVQYPTGEFLGTIAYPSTSPTFMGDNIWYDGFYTSTQGDYFLENPAPVFSPSFSTPEALSMFDNTRAQNGEDYLMHPSLDIAEIRNISQTEKYVLCHLGYTVEGAGEICGKYAPIAVDDIKTFGPDDSFVCSRPTYNDLWKGATWVNAANFVVRLFDFSYDESDSEIENVFFRGGVGNTIYTNDCDDADSNLNPFSTFLANLIFNGNPSYSKFARYSAFENFSSQITEEKRVSQEGRVIMWLCENPYNFICNGDFEKGVPLDEIDPTNNTDFNSNHLMQKLIANNWSGLGTTDIFIEGAYDSNIGIPTDWWRQRDSQYLSDVVDPYNTRFAGMANDTKYNATNNHREAMVTQLGKEMEVGQTYTISFEAWSSEADSSVETSDPDLGNHMLYIGLTEESKLYSNLNDIIDSQTGQVDVSNFDQLVFAGDLDDYDTYNSWDTIEFDFIPESENLKNMYIIAEAQITNMAALQNMEKHYLRYTLLDNITIEPQLPYRDLRVEKELLSSATTSIGEEVEFQVVVTNDSDAPVENVQIRDYVPEGFVVDEVSVPVGVEYTFIVPDNYVRIENIILDSGQSFTFNIVGTFTICVAEFRNVALAYSEDYLDETPENNYVDVFAQYFPFNEEIDNYTGYAEGVMGCAGEISGVVFYDVNQDGAQNPGEVGLGGYEISLYREVSPDNYELEQTTLSSNQNPGFYVFNPQLTGTYVVSVETTAQIIFPQDSGVVINGSSHNYLLDVQNNNLFSNRNFGIYDGYTISGIVYHDVNQDGQRQPAEELLENVDVGIYRFIDDTYFLPVEWATTNMSGEYSVDILMGEFPLDEKVYIRISTPGVLGIQSITQPQFIIPEGPNQMFLENAYTVDSIVEFENPYNFGVTIPQQGDIVQSISGYVFADLDNNGVWNEGENFAEGYEIEVISVVTGEVIVQQTTNAQGYYDFSDIPEGEYIISLADSNGAQISAPDQSSSIFGRTHYYSFEVSGQSILLSDFNFGLYFCPCGQFDMNEDCIVNAGDLSYFVGGYGTSEDNGDFNNDGVIDYFDSLGLLTMYACPFSNPEFAIAGYVYSDLNGNGQYDEPTFAIDSPVIGAPVRLYRLENNEWVFIQEEFTEYENYVNQPGAYMFSIDEPGEYAVVLADGYTSQALVEPVSGDLILENSSYVHRVTLSVEQDTVDYDNHFGLTEEIAPPNISTVTGVVFFDQNQNGTKEVGESGFGGYTVQLMNLFGEVVAQTQTQNDGSYTIGVSDPGAYLVTFDVANIDSEITIPQSQMPLFGFEYFYIISSNLPVHQNINLGIVSGEVVEEECACLGNLTGGACEVNQADVNILLADLGCQGDGCVADLNQSNSTNTADLLIMLAWYGCPAMSWLDESPELSPVPLLENNTQNSLSIDSEYIPEGSTVGDYEYNYIVTITNTDSIFMNSVIIENLTPPGFGFQIMSSFATQKNIIVNESENSALLNTIAPNSSVTVYMYVEQQLN